MIRSLLVLYGSQTGTAQETAERIGREAIRWHFQVRVSSMDEYDVKLLPTERCVIFLASTTGQGIEPDNMKRFWKFLLRKNLPKNSLQNLKFGVLAFGDSSYKKFNYVGKKLNRRLLQLGGQALEPIGLCDDQHDLGPDFVIDSWLKKFWDILIQLYPLPLGKTYISSSIIPHSKYLLTDKLPSKIEKFSFCKSFPYKSKILLNERITSEDHFQDTRLIRLDIAGSGISFQPGDVCNVKPRNSEENINFFFEIFTQFDRNTPVIPKENKNSNIPIPDYIDFETLEECVRNHLDIQSIPKRYFFELLSHFTKDSIEKEKFIEFCSAEGQQDLYDYCNRPRRNSLEVLFDFRLNTVPNIPLEFIFDLFPPIKHRSFSIASEKSQKFLELLVAVVKYNSKLATPRLGLCSNYLKRLNKGDTVHIWITPGTLNFNVKEPMVCVGPGTGLAPFRSFIKTSPSSAVSLFFGCRNKAKDFYFKTEWDEIQKLNPSFGIYPAFSRDFDTTVYVQHVLLLKSSIVKEYLLEKKGHFYIAGKAKVMPDQVMESLVQILGQDYVNQMEIEGRIQTETWS